MSAQIRRELEAVVAVFDHLRAKIESLTTVSRDALVLYENRGPLSEHRDRGDAKRRPR